jgi:hypothetical protein
MELADSEFWIEPPTRRARLIKAGRWGLFLATLSLVSGFVWIICCKVIPHQRASLVLTIEGTQPLWSIDETNWMLGGETEARMSRVNEGDGGTPGSILEQLTSLHRLTVLDLNPAYALLDADLRLLGDLTSLRRLSIDRTTNADEIWGPKVTDLGLVPLARLSELEDLSLANQRALTDAGLAALAGLPRLNSINLSGTRIGDAGLIHLRKCPSLRFLDLKNTDVTDAGLISLRDLRSLEMLDVEGTAVTKAGVDGLIPTLSQSVFVGYGKGAAPRPRLEFKEAYR